MSRAGEVYEYNDSGDPLRYFVHGVSYIDERLAMVNCYETTGTTDDRPYYYVLDRMYNVRYIVDRAGAIIERYAYDPYGKPLVRESGGRGDTTDLGRVSVQDNFRYAPSVAGTIWEPRCDMDDDGDVDSDDTTLYNYAVTTTWYANPTVAQAFSDVGNPYMIQGVPHFAIDTSSSATAGKFMLNHHRARFAEPVIGRWTNRDPLGFRDGLNLFEFLQSRSTARWDPMGTTIGCAEANCPPPPPPPPDPDPPPPPPCSAPIFVCVRKAIGMVGNHAYLWDPCEHQACGTGASSGSPGGGGNNGYPGGLEDGPYDPTVNPDGDCCEPAPGTEGSRAAIMECCRNHANDGVWFPGTNDCHNTFQDCLSNSGFSPPELPCGRFGDSNYCKRRTTIAELPPYVGEYPPPLGPGEP
ncbi:MAG: hypothetical protein IPK83_22595 [Planctomycetes bacterium]|nr:hypothetical protein [Planctomycetota bacterium]